MSEQTIDLLVRLLAFAGMLAILAIFVSVISAGMVLLEKLCKYMERSDEHSKPHRSDS